MHTLSQEATDKYEEARIKVQHHFNAKEAYEIILTAGTTHSINIIAAGFASLIQKDDEIIVSALEHHSNIVPWQMLCEKTGAILKVIPMLTDGSLNMAAYHDLVNEKTKLVLAGIISLIIFQVLIHLGVNIRLFPTTGMTLPFLSYGGSSIIGVSILSGIILNLTKRKVN